MSNLSHQFDGQQEAWEEIQRRRYARNKGVSGFIGNGYWLFNYPYMVGGIGSGTLIQTQGNLSENMGHGSECCDGTVGTSTGMGEGGTAASATGAAGGMPA